jgi:hypothetical protein
MNTKSTLHCDECRRPKCRYAFVPTVRDILSATSCGVIDMDSWFVWGKANNTEDESPAEIRRLLTQF